MATWPDCMGLNANGKCKQKGVTGPWHFIDVGLFEGPGHVDERSGAGSCLTEKIPTLIDNLKAGRDLVASDTLTFTPDRELRFLIHFLGDIRSRCDVDGPTSFDNEEMRTLVREQLFKGGVRLAAILNRIFQ